MAKTELTASEVAAIFGVTRETVHCWRREGKIPHIEYGFSTQTRKRYRFPKAEIMRLAGRRRREVQGATLE